MGGIKAGVVVITKFCKAGSSSFQSYIDYIDREKAKRDFSIKKWNLYQDYMGDPEKSTGLFTRENDELSMEQKQKLKDVFSIAQDQGSLMWQTVISFDNRWLAENNLYDPGTHMVDEKRLKTISRNAIEKMLKSEGLDQATWSAAFHYNTDNIHIHVATVEPVPSRKKKEYTVYKIKEVDGKKIKIPEVNRLGNQITVEEYVGKFKLSSLELCKSSVVNEIIKTKEINYQINNIIRKNIVEAKRANKLYHDRELMGQFQDLYNKLPDVDLKMWNYNTNIMKPIRKELDQLSDAYLQKYHENDFNEFKKLLNEQSEKYSAAYGRNDRRYEESKMSELYERLGNAILKEMRELKRHEESSKISTVKKKNSYVSKSNFSNVRMTMAMRTLNNSMEKEYSSWKNDQIHEAMLRGKAVEEMEKNA